MEKLSLEEIGNVKSHPLTKLLDSLRDLLQEAERFYGLRSISYDGTVGNSDQLYRDAVSQLLLFLQVEKPALTIKSRISGG